MTRWEPTTVAADADAMSEALRLARRAAAAGDVPVGAVVVHGGAVVGRGHNRREIDGDPLAHAEIVAIREAARTLGSWRLDDATLVVTLEPCAMCAGALLQSRVARLVYGTPDPKAGACGSLYNLCVDPRMPHEVEVVSGVRADESVALLQSFFAERRGTPVPTSVLRRGARRPL